MLSFWLKAIPKSCRAIWYALLKIFARTPEQHADADLKSQFMRKTLDAVVSARWTENPVPLESTVSELKFQL